MAKAKRTPLDKLNTLLFGKDLRITEGWRFRNLPAYGLWIRHAANIRLNNFVCNHPQSTWKKEIIKEDVL